MTERRLTVDVASSSPQSEERARRIEAKLESIFDVVISIVGTQPDTNVSVTWRGGERAGDVV